jgi:nucleoside-diphosphate-sugar epimerase
MATKKSAPKAPRSLVTGACGFIGSHVVEQLRDAGHEVIAADHPASWDGGDDAKKGRYPDLIRSIAAETHAIDLADPSSFRGLPTDVDHVFHVAAVFNYTAPLAVLRRINVEGGRRLLHHFGKSRKLKRWVQWGAGGVYGMPSVRGGIPFREDVAPMPSNNYLRSKWEQEFMVMEEAPKLGIDWTIIRPTTVYGPRAAYGSSQMFLGVLDPPVVVVPASMTGRIPFIHVVDVARAAIHLAGAPDGANQVFNTNDDTRINAVEFMQAMARLLGKPFIKLPPLPVGALIKAATPLLQVQFRLMRDVLKVKPLVEPDMVAMAAEDFVYPNDKLKATGFEFRYPDARLAFAETLDWYLAHYKNGR